MSAVFAAKDERLFALNAASHSPLAPADPAALREQLPPTTSQSPGQPLSGRPGPFYGLEPLKMPASPNPLDVDLDRQLLRILRETDRLIQEQDFVAATQYLEALLDTDHPASADSVINPQAELLRTELLRLLTSMPPEGRMVLETTLEPKADRMLNDAVFRFDLGAISAVAAEYSTMPSGVKAAYLLGAQAFERGDLAAGALAFEHVLASDEPHQARYQPQLSVKAALAWFQLGNSARAQTLMADLIRAHPRGMVTVSNGAKVPLPASADQAWPWLANAAPSIPRATASNNSSLAKWHINFAEPLFVNELWPHESFTASKPLLDHLVQLRAVNSKLESPVLPAARPVLIDGMLIARTGDGLLAVDLESGEVRWQAPRDERIHNLVPEDLAKPADDGGPQSEQQYSPRYINVSGPVFLQAALVERVWDDRTFASFAIAGQSIYCVEEANLRAEEIAAIGKIPDARIERTKEAVGERSGIVDATKLATARNVLRAYDLQTGRVTAEWPSTAADDPLAGCCFLGPPCVLGETLYVLVELGDESHGAMALAAIDARAMPEHALQWVVPLASVDRSILADELRRYGGLTPVLAGQFLLCPSGSGFIACVDPTSRSIRWVRSYAANSSEDLQVKLGGLGLNYFRQFILVGPAEQVHGRSGWAENEVLVVEGKAVVTPRDSDQLLCLRVDTGELAWGEATVAREEGAYVAGIVNEEIIVNGEIIVVGHRRVRGISLDSGKELWSADVPDERFIAGRGFLDGDRYVLPLNRLSSEGAVADEIVGEIAIVDLVARSLTLPDRPVFPPLPALGHLISGENGVISQDVVGLRRLTTRDGVSRDILRVLYEDSKAAGK